MVNDGLLVVLLLGRPGGSDPRDSAVMHAFKCIGLALNDLVRGR